MLNTAKTAPNNHPGLNKVRGPGSIIIQAKNKWSYGAHLSKRPSDLKENGTHKKDNISSRVFNTLSHGVICFVASVSSKKYLLEGWNSLTQPIRSFSSMAFEANTRNKTEHTMWKGMETCSRKWHLFLCTILFEVTWIFCMMWGPINGPGFLWHRMNRNNQKRRSRQY